MSDAQEAVMRFDPATCELKPYPSHAKQWRRYHGEVAWLYNPWTGTSRTASDIGSDVFGLLIAPPDEEIKSVFVVKTNFEVRT